MTKAIFDPVLRFPKKSQEVYSVTATRGCELVQRSRPISICVYYD